MIIAFLALTAPVLLALAATPLAGGVPSKSELAGSLALESRSVGRGARADYGPLNQNKGVPRAVPDTPRFGRSRQNLEFSRPHI
jgi:hypothetical protein